MNPDFDSFSWIETVIVNSSREKWSFSQFLALWWWQFCCKMHLLIQNQNQILVSVTTRTCNQMMPSIWCYSKLLRYWTTQSKNCTIFSSPNSYRASEASRTSYSLKSFKNILSNRNFIRTRPTVVFFHCLAPNKLDTSVDRFVETFLRRDTHNVVVLDWSYYAQRQGSFDNIPDLKNVSFLN